MYLDFKTLLQDVIFFSLIEKLQVTNVVVCLKQMILKEFSEKSYLIKEKEEPKGEREKKISPLSCLSLCFSFPPSLSSLLSSVCVCVYKVNFLLLRVILKKKRNIFSVAPPRIFFFS